MPYISQKGRIMPASPIRKLVPYAEKAKQQGQYEKKEQQKNKYGNFDPNKWQKCQVD